MKKLILTFVLLVIGKIIFAQIPNDNPLKTKLDSVVHKAALAYLKENKRMAVSFGFVANRKSYSYHYGETSPGSGKAPTSQSIYEIGSITKTFTGLLVVHAVNEGKMKLMDDIRKFLPRSFANLQYPNGDPVRVIYLLAHVAKFPNNFADEAKALVNEESFLNDLSLVKLDSLKGFKYAYSNVGYQLLGYVLERIYGMPYQDLVQKYIAKPLAMTHTRVSFPEADQTQLLNGYKIVQEKANAMRFTFPGAGGLRSTLPDMLNYLKYQMAEPDALVKLSHRITSGNIDEGAHAFQWMVGKLWNWDYYLTTDGGTSGFRSFCIFYPDYQMGFIALSNETDEQAGGDLYRFTAAVFNELKKGKY